MKKNELTKEQADEILKILDDLIARAGWDASMFLRVINKSLQTMREDFANKVEAVYHFQKSNLSSNLANRVAIRSGQQEVYISLYSADGGNMQAWERIVLNLPKQIISRPIYASEEDVNQMIRHKDNRINEAYVCVCVSQTDILSIGDKTPYDKLGKALLTLKDKAVVLSNIGRFVHSSGVYFLEHGRLIKQEE
jgi:intracellular multiplication protein IcmQ